MTDLLPYNLESEQKTDTLLSAISSFFECQIVVYLERGNIDNFEIQLL